MEGSNQAAPNDIENPYISLANSIRKGFDSLSPPFSSRCIYRVPQRLRSVNEKRYTPQVVSIGPLHHGKEGLNIVLEEHKQRYLQDFIGRSEVSLEDYIKKIKDQEGRLRSCYAEPNKFCSDEFVRIILVDAAFIIELLLKDYFDELKDADDHIFHQPYMLQEIWADMWLLENQLPFFILEDLFDPHKMTLPSNIKAEGLSIISLAFNFFKHLMPFDELKVNLETFRPVAHFVDLFRKVYKLHIPLESKAEGDFTSLTIPSLTELHLAGVKFKVGPSKNIFDIQFSWTNGVLKIPFFSLGHVTEIIRNVLAFEQCHCLMGNDIYMSDYAFLMGGLVKTPKDVALLVEHGIAAADKYLVGDTSDDGSTSTSLINISTGVNPDVANFYYATLCKDLNKYCSKPWHKWKANLRQKYFNTPWATISVIAAVVLLILTLIQTISSV